jgi:hypothetical protein
MVFRTHPSSGAQVKEELFDTLGVHRSGTVCSTHCTVGWQNLAQRESAKVFSSAERTK